MPLLKKPETRGPDDRMPPKLAELGLERRISAGAILVQQGASAESCFLLTKGEIALRRSSSAGDEVEIARIAEGQWFGEVILFAATAFPAQAVAVRDSELLEFRRSSVLASAAPEVSAFFLSLLARKCLALNRRIEELTIMDTRERLARYVLGLCPGRARGCEGGRSPCSFPLPKKKREIALELGMAPETLSRALRQMEEERYIKVTGSTLEVPSCSRLRSLVGE